jgi:serine/threonine protein kinase
MISQWNVDRMDSGLLFNKEMPQMVAENYLRGDRIYESTRTLIYKARRHHDNLPVIIKTLRSENPGDEALSAFRREYALLRQLNHEGIIRAHALEKWSNGLALVLEGFGGESLEALLHTSRFANGSSDLTRFLTFAVRIAGILADLHGAGIIHNHITPANIVVNPDNSQLKLIDFGEATKVGADGSAETFPAIAALTPAYISPEQTGKTNYVPDHRTDLYSLGVVFWLKKI